jgi:hypothetical protein
MKPSEVQGHVLAGELLTLAARKSSSTLDNFSGWLLAGFGAGFALLLANLDSITRIPFAFKSQGRGIAFSVLSCASRT